MAEKTLDEYDMEDGLWVREPGEYPCKMTDIKWEQKNNGTMNLVIRFVTYQNMFIDHYHPMIPTADYKFREFLRGMQIPKEVKDTIPYDKNALWNYTGYNKLFDRFFRKYLIGKNYLVTMRYEVWIDKTTKLPVIDQNTGQPKQSLKIDTAKVFMYNKPVEIGISGLFENSNNYTIQGSGYRGQGSGDRGQDTDVPFSDGQTHGSAPAGIPSQWTV